MPKKYELIDGDGARRLDFLMTDRKVSATELARAAGHADHSYIARMRKGDRRSRRLVEQGAKAVCKMLNCEVDYLFMEVPARATTPLIDSPTSHPVGSEAVVR